VRGKTIADQEGKMGTRQERELAAGEPSEEYAHQEETLVAGRAARDLRKDDNRGLQ